MKQHALILTACAALALHVPARAGHEVTPVGQESNTEKDLKKTVVPLSLCDGRRGFLPDSPPGMLTIGGQFSHAMSGFYVDSMTGLYTTQDGNNVVFLDSRYNYEDIGQLNSQTGLVLSPQAARPRRHPRRECVLRFHRLLSRDRFRPGGLRRGTPDALGRCALQLLQARGEDLHRRALSPHRGATNCPAASSCGGARTASTRAGWRDSRARSASSFRSSIATPKSASSPATTISTTPSAATSRGSRRASRRTCCRG